MPKKAVVLLSAGLDSTYNLFKAHSQFTVPLVLTFNYGQKAARREIERARKITSKLKLPHRVLELKWFAQFTATSLIGKRRVPQGRTVKIDNYRQSQKTAKSVWVPNRNGIFLNIAAGFAEGLGADFVIPGFNIEEAETFPDNSSAFLKTLDESWRFSTASKLKTHCFSSELTKTQIVEKGKKIKLPFHLLWPCYLNGDSWCGECESCLRFERALKANDLSFDDLKG